MCLKAFPHNLFVLTGSIIPGGTPIYIILYVDDFVYFIKSDAAKKSSTHPYHPLSKSTRKGIQTGYSEPHFNGSMMNKLIYQYTSDSLK